MTITKIATVSVLKLTLIVVLVDSSLTLPGAGDEMISRVTPHYPTRLIMLVSIEENGFRAHAHFDTHLILIALQREELVFEDIDLDEPLPEDDLPF